MIGSAVVATQFVAVRADVSFEVSVPRSFVQFMARDGDPNTAGGYVLDKVGLNETGIYQLNMGTWMTRANKEFSAAFAIVNAENNVDLTLTRIACTGAACSNVDIYVHPDPANNCAVIFGTPDACDAGWLGGAADPVTWILQDGTGFYTPQVPCAGSCLNYGDAGGGFCQSPWDVANEIWTYLTTCASNTPTTNVDNFVWVSVVIDTTGLPAGANSGTIEFFFDGN